MQAWIPIWILGAPFVGFLILNAVFKGGTSAGSRMDTPVNYR